MRQGRRHLYLLVAAALVACSTGHESNGTPAATLTVGEKHLTLSAWGRPTRFGEAVMMRAVRLDSAGMGPPVPGVFRSGRVLHAAQVGDTVYALLTLDASPSIFGAPASSCPADHETIVAWIRIPRFGNHPLPQVVRYDSCYDRTTNTGLRETADSIWVQFSSRNRERAGHVAYDPRHPERGMTLREAPLAEVAARANAEAAYHDSLRRVDDAEDAVRQKRQTPIPVLRDPALLGLLPSSIRDTLTARGCRVPQYVGNTNANLVRGNFFGSGIDGWAIWCIARGSSRILVFREGSPEPLGDLEVQVAAAPDENARYDSTAAGGQGYGCIGGISRAPAPILQSSVRDGLLAAGDSLTPAERSAKVSDGIIDGECDGASNIHYWTGRRWVVLPGGD